MKQIFRVVGLSVMSFGPALAADPTPMCMSIGGGGTQFSSTCDSCVVIDGPRTIDADEDTYGELRIVSVGSGTMRATAQSGVVFPAGSLAGFLQSSSTFASGDVEMLLRTYENDVLQEEFVVDQTGRPELFLFKTTRQYDAVEFSASQFDPNTTPPAIGCGYAMPTNCQPPPHEVRAYVREFCSNPPQVDPPPDGTPDAFTFTDLTGVEPGAEVTSAPVTISGIEEPIAISVDGGEYSIGCTATFTSAGGTIANNQPVCVRHTASMTANASTDTTLTVGGVSDVFTSTTAAAVPRGEAAGDAGGGALGPWLVLLLAGVGLARRRMARRQATYRLEIDSANKIVRVRSQGNVCVARDDSSLRPK